MKSSLIIAVLFAPLFSFAQDFSSVVSKVAEGAGETYGSAKVCDLPEAKIESFEKSISDTKSEAFPDASYSAYIAFFDEHYKKGVLKGRAKAESLTGDDKDEHCSQTEEMMAEFESRRSQRE